MSIFRNTVKINNKSIVMQQRSRKKQLKVWVFIYWPPLFYLLTTHYLKGEKVCLVYITCSVASIYDHKSIKDFNCCSFVDLFNLMMKKKKNYNSE